MPTPRRITKITDVFRPLTHDESAQNQENLDSNLNDLYSRPSFAAINTAAGVVGAQTINKPTGTVNFAAGASTLVVTNSLVTPASIVLALVRSADATAYVRNAVPAAGRFTLTLGAAATAETSVGFFVFN